MTHKPLRLDLKVRNNRLIKLREQLNLKASQAAEAIGVRYELLLQYESLQQKPFSNMRKHEGELKKAARKIAEFYGVSVEYLWSEDVLAVKNAKSSAEASLTELIGLLPEPPSTPFEIVATSELASKLHEALDKLPEKEKLVLAARAEGKTHEEIGELLGGLSRERSRQIETRGYKHMRRLLESPFE